MGSDVPTIWGTSSCTSEKAEQEAAGLADLLVKPMTAEVRRVTFKLISVSMESRGSKKRKSREHVHVHSSETSRGATSPTLVCGTRHGMLDP